MKAFTPDQRKHYEQLSKKLFAAVEDRKELPNGYSFRLAPAISMATAAEWAELESRCCPFFDFHLEKTREKGPLWLSLTGREGVKQFIVEEFK